MDSLPDELILQIFRCINFTTRLRTLSNVCRRWRRIVMDPSLFRGPLYINDADCNCINGGRNLNQISTFLTSCDSLRPTQLHIDSRYEEPLECLFNFLMNTSNCNSWKSLTRLSYHIFFRKCRIEGIKDERETCFVTLENFSLQKFIPSVNSNLSELTIQMLAVNTTHMKLICRHLRKLRLLSITCRGMERGCLTYLANRSSRMTQLIQLQLRIWHTCDDRVLYEAALVLEGFHKQLKFLFFWLPRKIDYFQLDEEAFNYALIKCRNLIIFGTNLGSNFFYPVLKSLPLLEAIFLCDNLIIYNVENLQYLRHLSILSPIIEDLTWGLHSEVGSQLLTLSVDAMKLQDVSVKLICRTCPNLVALKLIVFRNSRSIASMKIDLHFMANAFEKLCKDLTVLHLSYTALKSREKCWYWAVHHPRIIFERNALIEKTLNSDSILKRDAQREMDKINKATATVLRKLPTSKQCINCLTNVIFKIP